MTKTTITPASGYDELALFLKLSKTIKSKLLEKDSGRYLYDVGSNVKVEVLGTFDTEKNNGSVISLNYYENGVLVLHVEDIKLSLFEARFSLGMDGGNGPISLVQAQNPNYTFGSTGDDILYSFHSGRLFGRAGNDTFIERWGNLAKFDGESGVDTVDYSLATNDADELGSVINLSDPTKNTETAKGDTYLSIENIVGTDFDDKITGNDRKNVLTGGLGADRLDGATGIDTASYANAATGIRLNLATPSENTGEAAGDRLKNIEIIIGTSLADTLIGDKNNNTFFGGGGDDILDGGLGTDTLWGDTKATGVDNADTFVFNNPTSGVKNIMDYDVFDHIQVSREGFGLHPLYKITAGLTLIVAENVPVVSTNSPTFLFETSSGELRFDQDGTGSGGSVLIATIRFNSQQTLDVNDIVIV